MLGSIGQCEYKDGMVNIFGNSVIKQCCKKVGGVTMY